MRKVVVFVLLAFVLFVVAGSYAQQPKQPSGAAPELKSRADLPPDAPPASREKPDHQGNLWIVPAGTRIPVALRQPISTKNARAGDPIYGQTNFPVVIDENVVIPSGTYVQGVVDNVKRAGRIKGTAELQFHLTTLIYPSGYTLNLAAAIDQVPGSDSAHMKEPGTVQHDSEKGKDVERIGRGAAQGGAVGGLAGAAATGGVRGAGVGGLTGAAAGTMIALLARGSDVRFENGTVVNVVLNHAIAVDGRRVTRSRQMPAYLPEGQPARSQHVTRQVEAPSAEE